MSPPVVAPANWYERNVLSADIIIALVCTLLLGFTSSLVVLESEVWAAMLVVLAIAMTGSLAIRRTYPMVFVVIAAVIAILQMLSGAAHATLPSDVVVLIAVHTAARYCSRWFGYAALALALAGSIWAATDWMLYPSPASGPDMVAQWMVTIAVLAVIVVISYALGRAQLAKVRAIDAQLSSLTERNDLLRHEHEQQLKLATEQERGRIAAETHDILAHSLAIIVAQADGAAMLVAKDPARAQQAIEQIADTSREALDEVRQKVAALRRGEDPTADLAPARALTDLQSLVDSVRTAGLRVELRTEGPLDELPAGLSLSAYRIVQESLTNTLKHGGPDAIATVRVHHLGASVDLLVEDDGRGVVDSDGNGSGLTGMATRAEEYGGVLVAGPRAGGGFRVHARIPVMSRDN